jgi:hypothetical protein
MENYPERESKSFENQTVEDLFYRFDIERLLADLRVKNSDDVKTFKQICTEAEKIARPKYIYGISSIHERGDDFVVLDGIRFRSRVMSVNLSGLNRVFPFIATSGTEIEEWSKHIRGMLFQYWAEKIKETVLESTLRNGIEDVVQRYKLQKVSYMSPGSIADWPLSEQAGFFSLLGNVEADIGVSLTDHFLMLPPKTVSLLLFETDTHYENCQLCPREDCPNRRAAYIPDLYEKRYKLQMDVSS